jgi:alpha-tubulin suppressor-like RCC1 family protein
MARRLAGATALLLVLLFASNPIQAQGPNNIWAWGYGFYGGLGQGGTVPVADSGSALQYPLSGVTAVAGGYGSTYALKADGTVWASGMNNYGQLGNGGNTESTTPIQVRGVGGAGFLTGITAISAYQYGAMALKNDGTVYAWGRNEYGQLGDGSQLGQQNDGFNSNLPRQVSITGVVAIGSGDEHNMAVKSDGTVWRGDRTGGTLGTARTPTLAAERWSPTSSRFRS